MFFLGYNPGVKEYKLWSSESQKVIISRDVTFDETAMIQRVVDSSLNMEEPSEACKEKAQMEVEFSYCTYCSFEYC